MPTTRQLGAKYERVAEKFLKSRGYIIIEKNFFCKNGEIDIVAQTQDGQMVFVEVKARKDDEYGIAEEALTFTKKNRFLQAVQEYFFKRNIETEDWRCDLIAITADYERRKYSLRHYKALF